MRAHIAAVAWINIVMGAVGIVGGLLGMLLFLGIGAIVGASGPGALPGLGIFGAIGTIILVVLAVLSLPNLMAGIGLLQGASWARVLAIVVSVFNLVSFPLGTLAGIYGLIVLFHPETAALYERASYTR